MMRAWVGLTATTLTGDVHRCHIGVNDKICQAYAEKGASPRRFILLKMALTRMRWPPPSTLPGTFAGLKRNLACRRVKGDYIRLPFSPAEKTARFVELAGALRWMILLSSSWLVTALWQASLMSRSGRSFAERLRLPFYGLSGMSWLLATTGAAFGI